MVNLSMAISGNYPQKTATMEVSPVTQKSPQSPVEGAEALCILGDKYLFGYGVNRCYDSAFKAYFKAATEFQSPEASNMLGSMYEYGLGTAINMENAIKLYTEAAELRNLEALNNLGRIYETGKGLPGKDLQKASFYYLRAAELGHADAQTNIGYLIEHSIGSTADQVSTTLARTGTAFTQSSIEKAAEWYRLAAEKHDYARAQNFLGSLYYTGKGGFRRDYQQALRLFNRAADQGNSHAQNNLGICYEEGVAVERNYEKAKQFYRKASEANHPSATNNLAFLFLLERNYGEAIKTFHIAAALGSVDALYNIGTIFEAGVLHPEGKAEHALALRYFTEAAEKNYSKAQLKVFDYLNDGLCGPKDPQKAVEWLQSAAKLHSPEAQFRLAHAYEIGFGGLPRDFEEAKKWYQKSASLEYTPALLKLGQIFENGELGVEKDLDTALKIYIDAEALGEPDARQFADRIREVLVN